MAILLEELDSLDSLRVVGMVLQARQVLKAVPNLGVPGWSHVGVQDGTVDVEDEEAVVGGCEVGESVAADVVADLEPSADVAAVIEAPGDAGDAVDVAAKVAQVEVADDVVCCHHATE